MSLAGCIGYERLTVINAIMRMKQIREAEAKYHQANGEFASIAELSKNASIPRQLQDGEDMNYRFDLEIHSEGYSVNACPLSDTGSCLFMDQTGIIRASLSWTKRANANSMAIEDQQ